MIVSFESEFPADLRGEIDEVLHRISIGDQVGQWQTLPDRIHVLRSISGGRSGCDVLEIRVERGKKRSLKVVKLGPFHKVGNEYKAFDTHLQGLGRHFTKVEAATPAVLGIANTNTIGREAIVYDHARQFLVGSTCRTFEEIARDGVANGGSDLLYAIRILEDLFRGLKSEIYTVTDYVGKNIDLYTLWNQRLGIDATIEVDRFDLGTKTFYRGPVTTEDLKRSKSNPRDLMRASAEVEGKLKIGSLIYLENIQLTWRDDHLIGEFKYAPGRLRIELVGEGDARIRDLPEAPDLEGVFSICGRLKSLRTSSNRQRLIAKLPEVREDERHFTESDTMTLDPFTLLSARLAQKPVGRFTSLVHGDLNPRNILVVDNLPCLIDYAHTRKGAPLLLDFVTLETCLARDTLPPDLTWAQHVRLQRLLAAAWRLGNQSNEFAGLLTKESSRALRLLSAVRAAAYEVYAANAPEHLHEWHQDYVENLFFFAHSTLKWDDRETAAFRATAGIAGVAAECMEMDHVYQLWNKRDLLSDGVEVARRLDKFIEEPPPKLGPQSKNVALSELAALSRGLDTLRLRPSEPIEQALESSRVAFVRKEFYHLANDVMERRGRDHRRYIQLGAYIDLKGLVRETNELQDVLEVFASHSELVLLGDAGGGKTTCVGEWEYCLARAIRPNIDEPPQISPIADHPRMPIVVWAPALRSPLAIERDNSPKAIVNALRAAVSMPPEEASLGRSINVLREKLETDQLELGNLLAAGALHVTVDGLNEVEPGDKQLVANWIMRLRQLFPRTSLVACHRKFSYLETLLPSSFRIVELEKVNEKQAKDYIRKIFEGVEQSILGEMLIRALFQETSSEVRDLAQTPLFLWMIVELYRDKQISLTGRGQLFKEFAQWYMEGEHRKKRGDPPNPLYRYSYEEKAALLGHIGFSLVGQNERTFTKEKIFSFVPKVPNEKLSEMLNEIKDAEMLFINDGEYCFLHHSFQEFFAAWHFFKTEAADREAVRDKVDMYEWHDTIRMSVVFADLAPEAMDEIVRRSLVVDPGLAASVLRDAEFPDDRLITLFLESLVADLRNLTAGTHAWRRASAALAEFGKASALESMFAIAGDTEVAAEARAEVIKELAKMPKLTRFERQMLEIQHKLVDVLKQIMRSSEEPAVVLIAAIDAVERDELQWLYTLLPYLVESKDAAVGISALGACQRLGLVLLSSYEAKQGKTGTPVDAVAQKQVRFDEEVMRRRLEEAESKITHQTTVADMTQLNRRRTEILGNLAKPDDICLLLERRFRLGIESQVGQLVDLVVKHDEKTKGAARPALNVLKERLVDNEAIDSWAKLVRFGDACVAAAAAHRLAALGKRLSASTVRTMLDVDLPPDRLRVVASLVSACEDRSLVAPLETLLENLTDTIQWPEGAEAWAALCKALYKLDHHCGNRAWIVGVYKFFHYRRSATQPGCFPLAYVEHHFSRDDEDLDALMKRGGEDARAAVYQYSFWSLATLLTARRIDRPVQLDKKSLKSFRTMAESEADPHRQTRLACAAVQSNAVDLLPWFTRIIKENRSLKINRTDIYFGDYGAFDERLVAVVLRAKGYLARLLLDQGREDEANHFLEELRSQYGSLTHSEHPSNIVGLATALGYLGDWEPILTHLNQGYPYMLTAADSIFDLWVPRLPKGKGERWRAAAWIADALEKKTDLRPKERDTLHSLHSKLCKELGRFIGPRG